MKFLHIFQNQARSQDSRFFYLPIRWPATNTNESSRRLHVHVWPAIHNDISSSITLDSINITKTSHLIHNYFCTQLLCFEGPLVIIQSSIISIVTLLCCVGVGDYDAWNRVTGEECCTSILLWLQLCVLDDLLY